MARYRRSAVPRDRRWTNPRWWASRVRYLATCDIGVGFLCFVLVVGVVAGFALERVL